MGKILSKLGNFVKSRQKEIFLASFMALIALISYNLGQIDSLKKTPVSVKESAGAKADFFNAAKPESYQKTGPESQKLDTRVVASKNSDKYHLIWCSGAKRIKEENKIWFNSAQEAESMGYTLAGNCN